MLLFQAKIKEVDLAELLVVVVTVAEPIVVLQFVFAVKQTRVTQYPNTLLNYPSL